MNYYEHHINDYAEATAHLSFVEDAAYSRLIRKYYAREKPLPLELKECQRLVGARTKEEREAVEVVLNEFFICEEDGWHQKTCDEVIENYLEGEPERKAKKDNENNRLKHHREERSRLFQTLTNAGLHAPWNIKIDELRALVASIPATAPATNLTEPETQPATAPATPATATHKPIPNTQYPLINNKKQSSASPPDSDFELAWSEYPKRPGASKAESLKAWKARLNAGAKPADLIAGVKRYAAYVAATNTEPKFIKQPSTFFGPGDFFLCDWTVPAQARASPSQREPAWFMSKQGIDAKGRELGMYARGTESYDDFKQRIFDRLRQDDERQSNQQAEHP